MDPEFGRKTDFELEMVPYVTASNKTYFKRNYLYEDGKLPAFTYKKSPTQMRIDSHLKTLQKRFDRNMKILEESYKE